MREKLNSPPNMSENLLAVKRSQIKRTSPLKPNYGFRVSPKQREKVQESLCVVCQGSHCDPAHLADKSLGGCEDPDCVVALCRTHHRDYDEGRLDLLPHLEPRFRAELAHAVSHLGLVRALERLTNERLVHTSRDSRLDEGVPEVVTMDTPCRSSETSARDRLESVSTSSRSWLD